MSREVPNLGLLPPVLISEMAGEFKMVNGRETVQI